MLSTNQNAPQIVSTCFRLKPHQLSYHHCLKKGGSDLYYPVRLKPFSPIYLQLREMCFFAHTEKLTQRCNLIYKGIYLREISTLWTGLDITYIYSSCVSFCAQFPHAYAARLYLLYVYKVLVPTRI